MKKSILTLLFLSSTLISFSQNVAQRLDSLFQSLYNRQEFFGNVLVADKDSIIYQKSFGKANYNTNEDLNANSIFELASVSKQFTAMGVMLLKKEGKLKYEDSLRKFFPELPYHNITIRQLLNHTSGLPDYMELFADNWDSTKIATNKDIISVLAKVKPAIIFPPGERWEYSNTGYALLASIIEKVSGIEFGNYLDKKIFKPLEMKHSLVFRRRFEKRTLANYAYGYLKDETKGKFVLPDNLPDVGSMVYCLDGIVGDGTVNSTVNDLLKWDRALYTEKLVSKAMIEEAFSPAVLNDGTTFNYGFGWGISRTVAGKTLSHSGGWPGYNTYIERHIENGKSFIILKNHQVGSFPVKEVRNILYNVTDTTPKEATIAAENLLQYRGTYELAPEFSITITVDNGKIFAQATGQQKFEIFYEKEDLFFLKVVQAKLKFTRDENKAVTGLVLYQNGQEVEGVKKN